MIKLSFTDPAVARIPGAEKWLKECEEVMNAKINWPEFLKAINEEAMNGSKYWQQRRQEEGNDDSVDS